MTDRPTFDAFEQRLASELARYVAPAIDTKPAADIADVAMQPRGVIVRARNASARRRFFVLGVAAALLLPAVYLGAGGIRPTPVVPKVVEASPALEATQTAPPKSSIPTTSPAAQGAVSIFVRRDNDPEPGLSVFAVGSDGAEMLVRHVPDSAIAGRGKLSGGTVSESGWIALSVENNGGPWPVVLVNLRDEQAPPWVLTEASTGGIGPRWGPTGLLAAASEAGGNGGGVVIADPETRTDRIIATPNGLVGGGPWIIWVADGSGIVSPTGNGGYQVVPIDGGPPRPGVGDVFDARGIFGPGVAGLRICTAAGECPGAADGRVERYESDNSARTIWQQQGPDRALEARFGGAPDAYWLATTHAKGTQVQLRHLIGATEEAVASVNRAVTWQYVGAPDEAPDHSVAVLWIVDAGDKSAGVIVPLDGGAQTFHAARFAGFTARAAIASSMAGHSSTPGQALPSVGQPYRLPSVDQLIAAEVALNPGRHAVVKASRDAVDGDTAPHTVTVARDGGGELHFDCLGPTSATVTVGSDTYTSPCLTPGSNMYPINASSPIVVTATGDTSWRIVLYAS